MAAKLANLGGAMPPPKQNLDLALDGFTGHASYSPCQRFRYTLSRRWRIGAGCVAFVLLNPSTATAEVNDPTVRRCCGYARMWGMQELQILNIFALRSTDPKALYRYPDPIGPENAGAIAKVVAKANLVVCAWGNHGSHLGQGARVTQQLIDAGVSLTCLGVTKSGHPKHPLYLKANLLPVDFDPAALLR